MANAAPITGVCSCAPLNPKIDLPDLASEAQTHMLHVWALLHALDAEMENLSPRDRAESSAMDRILYFGEMGREIARRAADTCEIIEVEARRIKREGC